VRLGDHVVMTLGATIVQRRLIVVDSMHLAPPVIGSYNAHRIQCAALTAKRATPSCVRASPTDFRRATVTPSLHLSFPLMGSIKPDTDSRDLAEVRAIRRALGDHMSAVYASKATLGNSLGAARAVEAVLTMQAVRDGVVPPTLNLKNLDPEIDLDAVVGGPRRANYRYGLTNSVRIGGNNVAVVFGAY
jgi:hypothetical protein